jgi:3alpha(or 20beta)-hydroxysteroid dehydrogenase
MGKLDGKVALITGGARGQGAAEAELFAAEGATVFLSDVLDSEGEKTAVRVGGHYLHHDVTDEAQWADVVRAIVGGAGGVDVLVNNAGIFRPGGLNDISEAEYRRIIDVNQVGVLLGMQAGSRAMMERGGGAIVNISSVAGLRGMRGAIAYAASKWAVRGMTKCAALDLARYNIRVNSIHPGGVDTPMLGDVPGADTANPATLIRGVPMRRIAQAQEVAKLALFLASDDSSYSTGGEFVVDGGMTA